MKTIKKKKKKKKKSAEIRVLKVYMRATDSSNHFLQLWGRGLVFLWEFSFHFPLLQIMGKGPGLYSDIGKRARGYWFLHLHFWVIWCSICHFCWFFLQILLCFAFFFGRSSLQRLPERPEVHHHYLLPHWSCEFVLPHFLQFLDLFLCRRYTCGCNFHWWMNLEER